MRDLTSTTLDSAPVELQMLLRFIENDEKPMLVLEPDPSSVEPSSLLYTNSAFSSLLESRLQHDKQDSFRAWATDPALPHDIRQAESQRDPLMGLLWTCRVLSDNWWVILSSSISASKWPEDSVESSPPTLPSKDNTEENTGLVQDIIGAVKSSLPMRYASSSQEDSANHTKNATSQQRKRRPMDWLMDKRIKVDEYTTFFGAFMWDSKDIGSISSWSLQLRQMVLLVLANTSPQLLFWGPQMALLYNKAAKDAMIREFHPKCLGCVPVKAIFDRWGGIMNMVKATLYDGKTITSDNILVYFSKNGGEVDVLEEAYFSCATIPILGPDATAIGVLLEANDTTLNHIRNRRAQITQAISRDASECEDISSLWKKVSSILKSNPQDIPFALAFSIDPPPSTFIFATPKPDSPRLITCLLEEAFGVSESFKDGNRSFNLTNNSMCLSDGLLQAWTTMGQVKIDSEKGTFPNALVEAITHQGCHEATHKTAIICPLQNAFSQHHVIHGMLVIGLGPQTRYDETYEAFIDDISHAISSAIATLYLPDHLWETVSSKVDCEHAEAHEKILHRLLEVQQSEASLTRLLECAPVGCQILDLDGTPKWRNPAYFELTGLSKDDWAPFSWHALMDPEFGEVSRRTWQTVSSGQDVKPVKYRIPWPPSGSHANTRVSLERPGLRRNDYRRSLGHRWLMNNISLDRTKDGKTKLVHGWLVDITSRKEAEDLQAERLQEAIESKRQTDNFINMTSHELRNPLGAIIQSADGVLDLIKSQPSSQEQDISAIGPSTRDSIVEAINIILLCAQHQKRTVDYILILTRLDSDLLLIIPELASPVALVSRALKIFETEFNTSGIAAELETSDTVRELESDIVMLDPSRVLQVFTNLIPSAIGQVHNERRQKITCGVSVVMEVPSKYTDPASGTFVPPRRKQQPLVLGPDWGDGTDIYVEYYVRNADLILDEDQLKALLLHFMPNSSKTYAQYGKSDLGLFIARELAELQGGSIAFSSTKEKGTTFSFYVSSRRPLYGVCLVREWDNPIAGCRAKSLSSLYDRGRSSAQQSTTHQHTPAPTIAAAILTSSLPVTPDVTFNEPVYINALLVEDNFINQRVMSQQLRRAGCHVEVVNNGQEALDFLLCSTFATNPKPRSTRDSKNKPDLATKEKETIDSDKGPNKDPVYDPAAGDAESTPYPLTIILMDIEMPVMDGLTCVAKIREMQKEGILKPQVPVIAVTANARSEQIEEAISMGMDMVITKPCRIPELVLIMQDLLGVSTDDIGQADDGNDAP